MNKHVGQGIIEEEENTEGSWAISYGDMITLLLSFFVIFFSFDYKKEKEDRLQVGVLQSLAKKINLSHRASFEGEQAQDPRAEGLLKSVSTVIKPLKNGDLSVFFPGVNFFASGGTSLTKEGLKVIEEFISSYTPYAGKYKIKVLSFTDDTPVTKGRRYKDNLELSALRSVYVLRYIKKLGIPLERIELGGKGVMNPLFLNQFFKDAKVTSDDLKKYSRTIALVLQREEA